MDGESVNGSIVGFEGQSDGADTEEGNCFTPDAADTAFSLCERAEESGVVYYETVCARIKDKGEAVGVRNKTKRLRGNGVVKSGIGCMV